MMKEIKPKVKDIYIIENDINNKVYIGQAIDAKIRFQSHCKPSAATLNNELIGKAIQKYGKEHFSFRVLESQVENYNERERYWIKFYDSLAPNGYNLLEGGEAPPVMRGADHPEALLSEEQIGQLTIDLKEGKMSTNELLKKYGFTSRTSLNDFNRGKTYHRDIEYPIGKRYIGKLTDEDVDEIICQLRNTTRTYKDIGADYDVEGRAISRIDKGVFHKREGIEYPIRRK